MKLPDVAIDEAVYIMAIEENASRLAANKKTRQGVSFCLVETTELESVTSRV